VPSETRELAAVTEVKVLCPGCGRNQSLHVGRSACPACRLQFEIRVTEPRCPKCDYLLFMLKSDRCPECGHDLTLPADAPGTASPGLDTLTP
jgi:ribosomal protein L37E